MLCQWQSYYPSKMVQHLMTPFGLVVWQTNHLMFYITLLPTVLVHHYHHYYDMWKCSLSVVFRVNLVMYLLSWEKRYNSLRPILQIVSSKRALHRVAREHRCAGVSWNAFIPLSDNVVVAHALCWHQQSCTTFSNSANHTRF